LQPVDHADGLAVEQIRADAACDRGEMTEQPALGRAGVLHADHHLREQVLEDARWREVVGRTDLAQVGHHRLLRLGAIDGKACVEPLRVREQVIAHPCHGQVRQDAVVGTEAVEPGPAAGGRDERAVRLAHALGLARRAGRVEHDRHVLGIAARHLVVEKRWVRAIELAADARQLVVARDAVVMAHPARIVVVEVRQRRTRGPRLEQLVDLLLVFGERVHDLASLRT
jgi:hypothetical protein